MSNYSKRAKSMKRTHRERGQLSSRQHLGLLEKHKDYVLRARDYQRKKDTLKILHEKARNRNPDEFYYKMVHSKLKDGRHIIAQPEEAFTEEQLQIMKTQDIKYVEMKLTVEKRKIERLQSGLHMLDDSAAGPSNSHTIFVDTPDEAATFDPTKHFQTAPELVSRAYNRPTVDQLSSRHSRVDRRAAKSLEHERALQYKELSQRINRSRELERVVQKMKTQKHLMASKGQKVTRIPGSETTPVTYKWQRERKK